MSTYWGYACASHNPPLHSEHWVNHGEARLRELFTLFKSGDWPISSGYYKPLPLYPDGYLGDPSVGAYRTTEPAEWLAQHPNCRIVLGNEYGDTQPMETAP